MASQSARCLAAYLYSAAGPGESTTDLAWDGHALIYENGNLLAESERFSYDPQLITAEIDLERLSQERMRQTTLRPDSMPHEARSADVPHGRASRSSLPADERLLPHAPRRALPVRPADPRTRDERCAEVYNIQVQGLAKRLQFTGIEKVVIGVSGGLDSTQALLVCAQAMDRLGCRATQHPRLHHARLRHQRADPATRRTS